MNYGKYKCEIEEAKKISNTEKDRRVGEADIVMNFEWVLQSKEEVKEKLSKIDFTGYRPIYIHWYKKNVLVLAKFDNEVFDASPNKKPLVLLRPFYKKSNRRRKKND